MRSKILAILSLVLMIANLYMIFIFAPNEATMGVIQRIFYFHLPAGISSYVSAYLLGFGSIMFLIQRDLKWDRFAAASGEMGVLFTSLSIMSGALWAKPVWGIWWTWDARLTLQFLLALVFLSYLMLRAYLPEREKRAALGGVFRKGGVTVAVSTDGRAPALAGLLREALQALLPDDLESWAEVAQELRTHWKADGVALARRRPLLLRALNELYREVA